MGLFRVELEATGGHGCQREVGDGGTVYGCRRMDCPDCITADYVERMKQFSGLEAKIIHWPDAANWGGQSVIDEYVPSKVVVETYKNGAGEEIPYAYVRPAHRIRHGAFPEHPSKKTIT